MITNEQKPSVQQLKAEAYDIIGQIEKFEVAIHQLKQHLAAKNQEIRAANNNNSNDGAHGAPDSTDE